MNDIDLNNTKRTPINYFQGTFDGNYKIIKNFQLVAGTGNFSQYIGLFSWLVGGTVRNLTLNNAQISSTNDDFIGAFAGHMMNGKLVNCHVSNSRLHSNGKQYPAGGLIGYMAGNLAWIERCSAKNISI